MLKMIGGDCPAAAVQEVLLPEGIESVTLVNQCIRGTRNRSTSWKSISRVLTVLKPYDYVIDKQNLSVFTSDW